MIIKSKKIKIFDSDALKNFHKRIFFSIILFSCCYFIAIFRIADIMLLDAEKDNNYIIKKQVDRGKIYDRNSQLLSSNIYTHSLYVNSNNIENKFELSKKLEKIINIDNQIIYKKLNSNKNFEYLKRKLSPKEFQKIIGLGEIQLKTEIEKRRVYPFKNIASHLIGFVDIDNKGIAGLERAYENKLNSGEDIYLTIDISLQNAVQNELTKTIKKFSAESGSVIIMDIKNFEILSLNNYPDFDPNNINKSNSNDRINRVLQSNYEMGSTFKPLTIAIGIDNNLINNKMKFDVSKPIKNTIRDWDPCKCSLSIKDIIVRSSNIGTAKIAELIGKKEQISFFKKIGFFDPIKINFKEAAKPYGQPNNWGKIETMTIGYGHGFAITPLHLAVAYSSILNNGKKLNPKIILENDNKEYSQIIKNKTSNYIKKLLRAVVEETEYTGPRVKIDGYDIGGKTGTAELTNEKGQYDKNLNRTIFIGAFPMHDPKYLVLTFIDKPKRIKEENNSITSATVNAPLVKNIITKIIEIFKLPQQSQNTILNAATTTSYNNLNAIN